ncbi:MAG TPA: 4a-hydroxytetrahydrobiopterin dehydratase [Pyrinomonadaceae bacterium]|nr:4a-hydroxytetrahydrobiopterin dehydratase [Pyrinomonadaceae bacterium]
MEDFKADDETEDLASRHCVPCHGGVPRLRGAQLEALARRVRGWQVVDEHHLSKSYEFKNFADALRFVERVSEVAEAEGHHPDISFGWAYARIEIYTHAIDGLSESDFVLAAKIDALETADGS